MESAFWVSLWLLFYTWGIYGLCVKVISWSSKKGICSEGFLADITVLVTVFNEEDNVKSRLDNLLAQRVDQQRLHILVASDGSTDKTNAIVETYEKKNGRVRLLKMVGRGKSITQNVAIPMANGQIVVLTDADTLFAPDTVEKLVRHFSEPDVGCVSGRLVLKEADGSVAESQGLYWNFEMALRRMESATGLMHTASGGIMAFRKDLFRPFDPKYGDDCIIPLDILEQGYRVVHDDEAIAYDSFPSSMKGELRARTRMTLRNITCTLSKYRLLNPFRHPGLCWAIISHKILRWLTPFFMLAVLVSNVFLVNEGTFYLATGVLQALFYLLGLVGLVGEVFKIRIPLASQIFSFLLANTGFLLGVLQASAGRHVTAYRNKETCQGA